MAMGEDIGDELLQSNSGVSNNHSPDGQTLLIMDSIIQRLKPKDSHHVREMINQRGLMSGALMMTSALFWWISIKKGGNTVNDSNIPASMIGQFEFEMLSLIDNSKFVITDSGGVVRESYWLEKPSLLLLDKPLWPELVDSGVCLKTNENNIIDNYKLIKNISSFPRGIYGDGDSAKKITKWLCDGF